MIDEIHLTANKDGKGTDIKYVANISLRHVFKLLTPLIMGDLRKMAADAEVGIKEKIK